MSNKWYLKVPWPLVAALFQVCFAGYLLGMVNQRLSAVVVADTSNLAIKEAEYDRGIALATDPALKRELLAAKAKLAAERAALREKEMQISAQGQILALAVLAVAVYCLSQLIRSTYPAGLYRWIAAGANLGVLAFIALSTYWFVTSPYDTSTSLGIYSFCSHLVITILALCSSLILQVWLTMRRPA